LTPFLVGGGHFCEFHFRAFNKCSFCGSCSEEDRCHEVKEWVIQQRNVSINLSHRYVLFFRKESGQSGGVDLWKVNSRVLRFCKHDAREASKAKNWRNTIWQCAQRRKPQKNTNLAKKKHLKVRILLQTLQLLSSLLPWCLLHDLRHSVPPTTPHHCRHTKPWEVTHFQLQDLGCIKPCDYCKQWRHKLPIQCFRISFINSTSDLFPL